MTAAFPPPNADQTALLLPFSGVHLFVTSSDANHAADPAPPPANNPACPSATRGVALAAEHTARTLADIAELRTRHVAKGHTPETDRADHGPLFFWHGAQEFFRKAMGSRSTEKRRARLIAAAAMLVALIDAEDTQPQEDAIDAA